MANVGVFYPRNITEATHEPAIATACVKRRRVNDEPNTRLHTIECELAITYLDKVYKTKTESEMKMCAQLCVSFLCNVLFLFSAKKWTNIYRTWRLDSNHCLWKLSHFWWNENIAHFWELSVLRYLQQIVVMSGRWFIGADVLQQCA